MPRLTARAIHNKEFKRTFRGYDVNEVNDFLDQIIKDYIEFENARQPPGSSSENEQLTHVEHLLEQLMYEIQQLREENRLLREQLERPIYPDPYRTSQQYYR